MGALQRGRRRCDGACARHKHNRLMGSERINELRMPQWLATGTTTCSCVEMNPIVWKVEGEGGSVWCTTGDSVASECRLKVKCWLLHQCNSAVVKTATTETKTSGCHAGCHKQKERGKRKGSSWILCCYHIIAVLAESWPQLSLVSVHQVLTDWHKNQ